MSENRGQWKSRTGFIMAAMGSAIGLGNIWRFPYIAYENGGGVFLVPYFIALFLVGIPLMMLEFGLGHKMRLAFPGALRRIDPRFNWIGWWAVSFVMFGIVVYYCVVIAYCVCYLTFSGVQERVEITNDQGAVEEVVVVAGWGADPGTYFHSDFLGLVTEEALSDGGTTTVVHMPQMLETDPATGEAIEGTEHWNLGGMQWHLVWALLAVWLICWVISFGEVQRGIERANKIFIPLLVMCLIILVGWSWFFEGAAEGRGWYLNGIDSANSGKMNWSRLTDSKIWVDAFGQIFFTLSLGFGIMCAYSSYMPKRGTDVPGNAVITAAGNSMFEFFAGFAVFSTVGFIAMGDVANLPEKLGGPGLCFVTYPIAINQLIAQFGYAGNIFGMIFFGALVMAGLSSAVSITEAFGAAVQDTFGFTRKKTVTVLCIVAFLGGLIFCTQSGLVTLDVVDHFICNYGLVSVAALETLIVAWFFSSKKMRQHLDDNADFQFHNWLGVVMRVVITASLVVLWYGLTQIGDQGLGVSFVRMLTLLAIAFVWLSEHWLDFDYKIVIPALLFFLLDQALVNEIAEPYEGYPKAVVWLGASWLGATILIAAVMSFFALRRPDPAEREVDEKYSMARDL